MNISKKDLKGFRFEYKEAVKAGKEDFIYKNEPFLVSYAHYLLEYLESLGDEDESVAMNKDMTVMKALSILQEADPSELAIVRKRIQGVEKHIVCLMTEEGAVPLFIAVDEEMFSIIRNDL